jgi:hypothetical protein
MPGEQLYTTGADMMKCKQATELMSQAQDRELIWRERIALRFHLMMCRGCNCYNNQLSFIRNAMKQFMDR